MGEKAAARQLTWSWACKEALMTLGLALEWELPCSAWVKVAKAIKDMADAAEAGHAELLRQATNDLGACGGWLGAEVKVVVGESTRTPAPVWVLEPSASLQRALEAGSSRSASSEQGAANQRDE